MACKLAFLSPNDLPTVYRTYRAAFADYVRDVSQVTETVFTNRAIKNGVDLGASVGIFDRGEMVGFTLVGLGEFEGCYAAFDAGTGVVKPYRGQGLAKAMFDWIKPGLREKGVERFYLEVIQSNTPAVRAYQKAGFSVTRELDSFEIQFGSDRLGHVPGQDIIICTISKADLEAVAGFFDWHPSWENSIASIRRLPDLVLLLGAFVRDQLVGFLAYYPTLNWILSLAVHRSFRRRNIGTALLGYLKAELHAQVSSTNIINIEQTDSGMIEFLRAAGFEFAFNQFEMVLDLCEW